VRLMILTYYAGARRRARRHLIHYIKYFILDI